MLSLEKRLEDRAKRKAEEAKTSTRQNAANDDDNESVNENVLKLSASKIADIVKDYSVEQLEELHALESAKGDKARANVLEVINDAGKKASEKQSGWTPK